MTGAVAETWSFADLVAQVAEAALAAVLDGGSAPGWDGLARWRADHPDSPLEDLAGTFGLDDADCAMIALLFAAATSEPVARQIETLSTEAHGVPIWLLQKAVPGFEPAHLARHAPLCRFCLVDLGDGPRITARLRLPDALVDRLSGLIAEDANWSAIILPAGALGDGLPDAADAVARVLETRDEEGLSPLVLGGELPVSRMAGALRALGLRPFRLRARDLPADPEAQRRIGAAWSRDAALDGGCLIIEAGPGDTGHFEPFADRVMGHVLIAGPTSPDRFTRPGRTLDPSSIRVAPEAVWAAALGPDRAAGLGQARLRKLAHQFHLSDGEVRAVCALPQATAPDTPDAVFDQLWRAAAHVRTPPPIAGVVMRDPVYTWDDLVLPQGVDRTLRSVASHVRHATTVLDDWGFDRPMGGRGRGIAVLFSGGSGTGKTMAAEVLTNALNLRMMVIDLSQVISKYIGETSKNVAAAFAEAERSGAVMVWNEGDAIWGARGQVGSATDRHVNAETGDLLSKIEEFKGFTIITTNLADAIDPAFRRRFRFVVDFPLPSRRERLHLWQKAFPAPAPLAEVDLSVLADLPLSGGSIRNIALKAAFAAAEAGELIDAEMIEAELAAELAKEGRAAPVINWGTPS